MNQFHITRAAILALTFAALTASISRADIFQWEYINPDNSSEGKQPSTTLCPDGAGVVAEPFANLSYRNLTQAYLFGADLDAAYLNGATLTRAYLGQANLTGASFWYATLTNADLSQANLTNATFYSWFGWGSTTLTDADLTDAVVAGASFFGTTSSGFSKEQLYSTASYKNHDLSGIGLVGNDLTGWNFVGQNLTNAYFANRCRPSGYCGSSTLTDVDLTDAVVVGANFALSTSNGFTKEQLYSTAGYKNHDLSRIGLTYNDLTGWNFVGQNLTGAVFRSSTLTGADLTDALVVGATFENTTSRGFTQEQLYSTASYKNRDLSGINLAGNDLTGWSFAGHNLTNATFGIYSLWGDEYSSSSGLSGADLTDAIVVGANFEGTTWSGFTKEQLYSTASYKDHDLSGINLGGNDLTGWNFAGQNLTSASLYGSTLTDADLSQANLANAYFESTALTNADLRSADARGAYLDHWYRAIVSNTILPGGHIFGLDLNAGKTLVIRDYDGNPDLDPESPPIPIVIDGHFNMAPGGVLQLLFEADTWDSTISFEPGIPVVLTGGTLDLQLAAGVIPASQVSRTIRLFDWTGVARIGEFSIVSPYLWDASRLYSAGEITFVDVPEASSLALLALGFSSQLLRRPTRLRRVAQHARSRKRCAGDLDAFPSFFNPRRCAMNRLSCVVTIVAIALSAPMAVDAAPFTVGANFTGTDLSAINASHFPWNVPPDTMGAVGPDRIAELINTSFAVYDRTGVLQTRVPLKDFWENALANAGTAATVRGPFDPRLLYDPSSSRWFAVSTDGEPLTRANSQILVGVTTGSDPSPENWRGFAIDADSNDTHWADFPTVGLDNTGLYIASNMVRLTGSAPWTVTLMGVPKSSLTAGVSSITGFRVEEVLPSQRTGRSMQPAVDLDGGSSPLEALGEPSYTSLKRTLIPMDWISGGSNMPAPVAGDTLSLQQYDPPLARQPGPYDNIHTGDNKLSSNVVLQNGSLWAVQGTNVGGRAAINFLEIDGTSPTATFRQKITISDPSLDLYYPSVAVNDLGDVVIGFSGSDNSTPISTYVVVGTTTDGVTEFGPITQTHAGTGEYFIIGDPRNRWGDYSATVLDPVKPRTFWTFQEFVNGNMATPPFFDNWAVRITEITLGEVDSIATLVPEPATWPLLLVAAGLFYGRRRTSGVKVYACDMNSRRRLTGSCESLAYSRSRKQPEISRLINLTLAIAMLLAGHTEQAQATQYDIVTFDYPGATETETWGINDAGQIVGVYRIGTGTYQSFVLSDGVFTPFEHPDATNGGYMSTWINDINSSGQIVGAYDNGDRVWRGFLYDGANYVDVEPFAGSPGTFPDSLNDSTNVVGFYNDGSINRGFLFDGTSYTTLNDTNTVHTQVQGINNSGVIAGEGFGGSDLLHAFFRPVNGAYTNFRIGNSPTKATGINDLNQVVGWYGLAQDDGDGFVISGGVITNPDIIIVEGAAFTVPQDINNLGQVVGWYGVPGYFRHGFLATPIPDIPGDYNRNGEVDAADYVVWRDTRGSTIDMRANGDNYGSSAHLIDAADYDMWRAHFGQSDGSSSAAIAGLSNRADAAIPEPASVVMMVVTVAGVVLMARRPARGV